MDHIVGLMILIIVDVVVMGTGRRILNFFGRTEASKKAIETVGVAFWFAAAVGVFYLVRYFLSESES